jgi:HK97 family phage prohead protease
VDRFLVELREATVTADRLAGWAAVFGQHAEIRGAWEALAPSAFAKIADDNVRALVNHDPSKLLGSTAAQTLRLDVDDVGLAFEVDLPDTSYARDLRSLVERGDLSGASFGFVPGQMTNSTAPDGRQLRTHTQIRQLLDVSVVTYPAYEGTAVALRHVIFDRPAIDRRTQMILARHRARNR